MKKVLNICFIIILFVNIFAQNTFANNENSVQIKGNDKINPGEEMVLTLSVAGDEKGIVGMQGTIKYDKETFELINIESIKEEWSVTVFNKETGMFMIEPSDDMLYDKDSYIYNQEDLIKITIKAKENVKIKNQTIGIEEVKIVNGDFETIEIENISNKLLNETKLNKIIIFSAIGIIILALVFVVIKVKKK